MQVSLNNQYNNQQTSFKSYKLAPRVSKLGEEGLGNLLQYVKNGPEALCPLDGTSNITSFDSDFFGNNLIVTIKKITAKSKSLMEKMLGADEDQITFALPNGYSPKSIAQRILAAKEALGIYTHTPEPLAKLSYQQAAKASLSSLQEAIKEANAQQLKAHDACHEHFFGRVK